MSDKQIYKKASPGDWYIRLEKDRDGSFACCTAGGAPHITCPHLCTYDEIEGIRYCYIKAQPQGEYEIYQMIRAAWVSEFHCVRYAGQDDQIIERLMDIGIAHEVYDEPISESISRKLRNHCTFKNQTNSLRSVDDIANDLQLFFLDVSERLIEHTQVSRFEIESDESISFLYTWTAYQSNPTPIFHKINIQRWPSNFSDWLITHSLIEQPGSIFLSMEVDSFLRKENNFTNLRWYSLAEWQDGNPHFWRETPY